MRSETMNRAVVRVGLIFGICGLAVSGLGADPQQRLLSVLEGVPGLEKPVSYTETKIPLGELVRKVAAETGVRLTTAKNVADEPVAVVVQSLCARELLEQLAALLDYHWSRRGEDKEQYCEIWQDPASQQRERALRESVFAEAKQRLEQEIQRCVEVAALTPEQLQGLREADEQRWRQLQALPSDQREAILRSAEAREWDQRLSVAAKLSESPIRAALAGLLGSLSSQQWTLLLDQGRPLVFSTHPQFGELPLPAAMARSFRGSQPMMFPPGAIIYFPDPGTEQSTRQHERATQEAWAAATGYRVTVQRDEARLRTEGLLLLNVSAVPIRSGAPVPSSFLSAASCAGLSLRAGAADLQQRTPTSRVPDRPLGAQQRAAFENDPVFGARAVLNPTAKRGAASSGAGSGSSGRFQGLLPLLARTYGVSFISDAYWNSPHFGGDPTASAAPPALYELLDRFAAPTHGWDRRRRLVRLRSRTWFLDRPQEVPLRLVRRWKELYNRQGALPQEEWLENVASLSDSQLETLANVTREAGLPADFANVYTDRHALRLYASLTPSQREALEEGQAIAVAQMTPRQRGLFLAILQERSRFQTAPVPPTQWAGGSLTLTIWHLMRVGEQKGRATCFHSEPAAGSAAAAPAHPVLGEAATVTGHPVTQVMLCLQYSPEVRERESVTLTFASPGPPVVHVDRG
jgi:hypothetical protein